MAPESGEKLWESKVGNPGGVAVFETVIVVGSSQGVLRAFDRQSGAIHWCLDRSDSTDQGSSGVVRADDRVVTLEGGEAVALDPESGAEIWRHAVGPFPERPLGQSTASTIASSAPVLVGGPAAVWIVSRDIKETVVEALNPADGTVLQPIPALPGALPGNYHFAERGELIDGLVLTGTPTEYVAGRQEISIAPVAATTGDVRWTRTVPGFFATLVPSVDGALVVVIDQTGGTGDATKRLDSRVAAYSAVDGDQVWQVALEGTPLVAAGAGPDTVVVSTMTQLFAYESSTGDQTWVVNHGSPGRGGPYSRPGRYAYIAPSGQPFVAMIVAERPFRD